MKAVHSACVPPIYLGVERLYPTVQQQGSHCLYKQLPALRAQKRHQPYSSTMGWLRTDLSVALLRSAVLCLRGSPTKRSPPVSSNHVLDLMVSKGCLDTDIACHL